MPVHRPAPRGARQLPALLPEQPGVRHPAARHRVLARRKLQQLVVLAVQQRPPAVHGDDHRELAARGRYAAGEHHDLPRHRVPQPRRRRRQGGVGGPVHITSDGGVRHRLRLTRRVQTAGVAGEPREAG